MPIPVNVKFAEPNHIFVEYDDGMKGTVSIDDILEHKDYAEIKDEIDIKNVSIAEDGDLMIDGKIRLCKNATYGILQLKEQMKRLGLEL